MSIDFSSWNSKRPAVIQVHDEWLPGLFKLQESFSEAHFGTSIILDFSKSDQKKICGMEFTDFTAGRCLFQ